MPNVKNEQDFYFQVCEEANVIIAQKQVKKKNMNRSEQNRI